MRNSASIEKPLLACLTVRKMLQYSVDHSRVLVGALVKDRGGVVGLMAFAFCDGTSTHMP